MAKVGNALVVGGGIAGMAAALRLQQTLDAQVEVVEIDDMWRVYGTGLTMTGAALRAFDGLGLFERLRERGFVCSGTRLLSPACTPLSDLPVPPGDGPITLGGGILRSVLHEILGSATRAAGIAVKLGISVRSLIDESDRVRVRFDDGSEGSYDLVVGADGIHSRMRELLFENAAGPARTGQGCYRLGQVERPASIDRLTIVAGHGVPLGFIPVSRSHMYMFLLEPAAADTVIHAGDYPARLRGLMQGLGGVGAAVREQIGPAAEIDYRPLESILVPPPWHRGRVVLIGDAVHATTPHLASGAGLAVEDALVLCQELESAASVEQALAAHTERRYPRCRAVVETSLAIAATQLTKAPPTAMFQLMQQGFATLLQPY